VMRMIRRRPPVGEEIHGERLIADKKNIGMNVQSAYPPIR
jgi:hypothetical protein